MQEGVGEGYRGRPQAEASFSACVGSTGQQKVLLIVGGAQPLPAGSHDRWLTRFPSPAHHPAAVLQPDKMLIAHLSLADTHGCCPSPAPPHAAVLHAEDCPAGAVGHAARPRRAGRAVGRAAQLARLLGERTAEVGGEPTAGSPPRRSIQLQLQAGCPSTECWKPAPQPVHAPRCLAGPSPPPTVHVPKPPPPPPPPAGACTRRRRRLAQRRWWRACARSWLTH